MLDMHSDPVLLLPRQMFLSDLAEWTRDLIPTVAALGFDANPAVREVRSRACLLSHSPGCAIRRMNSVFTLNSFLIAWRAASQAVMRAMFDWLSTLRPSARQICLSKPCSTPYLTRGVFDAQTAHKRDSCSRC